MRRIRRFDGLVQAILVPLFVGAVIYACRPAEPEAAIHHDPATCDVCRHQARPLGVAYARHDLAVSAERHLELCAACRAV